MNPIKLTYNLFLEFSSIYYPNQYFFFQNSPEMENFPPNMSKADIKKRQAEIKRKAREEEKQRKIDQKQKEKDVKMREKMIKKADTLEECTKVMHYIIVC